MRGAGLLPGAAAWNSGLPDASQLGSPYRIQTYDHRLHNAVVRNGSLWTVHTAGLPANGEIESAAITRVAGPTLTDGPWNGVVLSPRVTISRMCTPSVMPFASTVW